MALPMIQGIYRARAVSAEPSEHNGKWRVTVLFNILDMPEEQLTWYGYFSSEAATKIAVKALDAMGWNGDLNDLSGVNKNEVNLTVEPETWEGTTRLKVKWVNPIDSISVSTPLSDNERKKFASEVKGLIAQVRNAGATTKAKPKAVKRAANGSALSTDDVPF